MVEKNRRKRSEQFGRSGEFLAAMLLRLKGYHILGTRLKMAGGEIDIVARHGARVVFVEVKWRASREKLPEALAAVNQKRIISAARHWMSRNPRFYQAATRFDVIALAPFTWPMHIVNAYQTN